jgi:hypothetical protein
MKISTLAATVALKLCCILGEQHVLRSGIPLSYLIYSTVGGVREDVFHEENKTRDWFILAKPGTILKKSSLKMTRIKLYTTFFTFHF